MSTNSNPIDSIDTEHSIVYRQSSIEYSIDRIHILSYPTKN